MRDGARKKILVIGADGYDNVSVNVERAFREIGHDAERFYAVPDAGAFPSFLYKFLVRSPWYVPSLVLQEAVRERMGRRYLEKIRVFKPDVIFVVHFNHWTSEQVRIVTKNWGVPVAWWVMADAALVSRFDPFHLNLYSHATHLFIADTSWMPTFRLLGDAKISYLPFAADPFLYHPLERPREFEVGIVAAFGQAVPTVIHKGLIISRLAREGISVTAVAQGMQKYLYSMPDLRRVNIIDEMYFPPQVNEFYNKTKLLLTLNNPQAKSDPHVRVMEAAAARAFQISEYRENTERLMGNTVVQFRTLGELGELARFYLASEKERERLAEASYRKVLREHTVRHRMEQVLREVFKM